MLTYDVLHLYETLREKILVYMEYKRHNARFESEIANLRTRIETMKAEALANASTLVIPSLPAVHESSLKSKNGSFQSFATDGRSGSTRR